MIATMGLCAVLVWQGAIIKRAIGPFPSDVEADAFIVAHELRCWSIAPLEAPGGAVGELEAPAVQARLDGLERDVGRILALLTRVP